MPRSTLPVVQLREPSAHRFLYAFSSLDIVADEIMVAFGCIELRREAADVAPRIISIRLASNGRKARKHFDGREFLLNIAKPMIFIPRDPDIAAALFRQIVGTFR
jgi:hypothetical protein